MTRTTRRLRSFIVPALVLVYLLLGWCTSSFALNPNLDVSQYAHTSWKIRDGFTKGVINSIAQTSDGYLWLGTDFGLVRFDGVKPVPWRPPTGEHLPNERITNLLVARDGTLWIGSLSGLASWQNNKLTLWQELAGQLVMKIVEDHEGTIWVGTLGVPSGKLCSLRKGKVECFGDDGRFGRGILDLYEDTKGNIWAGVTDGIVRWKPGPQSFYSLPNNGDSIGGFHEDYDGALLISTRNGMRRLVAGKIDGYSFPGSLQPFARELLRDGDGGLWIGTGDQGLMHVHQGRTDFYSQGDGLTANNVSALFEDREGNIWVGTLNGLDRFRAFSVSTFSEKHGFAENAHAVLAAKDGSVWLASDNGLFRWLNGQFTTFGEHGAQAIKGNATRTATVNGQGPNSLFEDARGRIWVSTAAGIGYLEKNRFIPVPGIPGGSVHAIGGDLKGNLWIANQDSGLFSVSADFKVQHILWTNLGRKDFAYAIGGDPLRNGIWLGFYDGGISYLEDGQIRASYTTANGLGSGVVRSFHFDPDGTIWIATAGGLSRLKGGKVATLSSKNGLPCDGVQWIIEDADHFFWLPSPCGFLRIARAELDAWSTAVDKDGNAARAVHADVFDSSDGVRSSAFGSGHTPLAAKSLDGKLWFTGEDGVAVVDPRYLPFNRLPPPLHIQQITADRKAYEMAAENNGSVTFPALSRDLQIDYTAFCLVAPETIQFRYKLEGYDRDWQSVGNRRQAFYTNLPPRNYRFRVIASNNSGVWNETGTFIDFTIAPAYYQTTWFRVLLALVFVGVLVAIYQLRLQQVARQFNVRMEERVNERTRIARDLHDTLLQSFQGLIMKFHSVSRMLPDRPAEARQILEGVIDQAEQAITEGRDAVQGLRSSTVLPNDLSPALRTLGEELAVDQAGKNSPNFRLIVQGTPRDLVPLVRDEVYRIAGEALRNAFRHAQADQIEVEILYDKRQLRVRVRDNGNGIDPKVLAEGGRAGHFGIAGMRERAGLLGGKLMVLSKVDSGTEAELTVPASLAYSKSRDARRSIFVRDSKDDDAESVASE